jgi:hypothetical protein
MDLVGWLALCAVLLALGLAAALAVAVVGRRRLEDELQEVRADLGDLRKRLDSLAEPDPPVDRVETSPATEYLITTLPTEGPEETTPISSGQFVSVAVGESVVRIVSLAYGVRRALSPQQRNRIRFEMGREVKRSRRQRRRDLRDARRDLRTRRSAGSRPDLAEDAA